MCALDPGSPANGAVKRKKNVKNSLQKQILLQDDRVSSKVGQMQADEDIFIIAWITSQGRVSE